MMFDHLVYMEQVEAGIVVIQDRKEDMSLSAVLYHLQISGE